ASPARVSPAQASPAQGAAAQGAPGGGPTSASTRPAPAAAPATKAAPAAPTITERTPAGGVQRYGEAVIRQVLGATFLREEPYEPPTRFS
ncbi:hypothetical protein, partial [Microbacterium sp. UFMG61]|uniref:hypothetical protein n=1 Tax=Microbacterium sp. UFMG61 TaxID=2745935 RepID=UPI00188F6B7B